MWGVLPGCHSSHHLPESTECKMDQNQKNRKLLCLAAYLWMDRCDDDSKQNFFHSFALCSCLCNYFGIFLLCFCSLCSYLVWPGETGWVFCAGWPNKVEGLLCYDSYHGSVVVKIWGYLRQLCYVFHVRAGTNDTLYWIFFVVMDMSPQWGFASPAFFKKSRKMCMHKETQWNMSRWTIEELVLQHNWWDTITHVKNKKSKY